MRRVIFNQKGGVGKSTITCNLAAVSAHFGHKTLVVDLDPQSNATQYLLGPDYEKSVPTIADYYDEILQFNFQHSACEKFLHKTPFDNLYILPASPMLDLLQTKLELRRKIYKLKNLLDNVMPFDNIFVDTPPAMNFYTQSALIASDTCLIPFDCDLFSRNAIYRLLQGVSEIKEDHNAKLRVEGVVVNQFQPQASLPRRLVDELRQEGLPIIPTFLSSSIKIRESHDAATPMVFFAPKHKLTGEFIDVFKHLKAFDVKKSDALKSMNKIWQNSEALVEEAEVYD